MLQAMNESGFDTLKATRALEAAGFESRQAEAMVTVFGGVVVGNVATKWDIRDLKDDITAFRKEVDAKLHHEIGGLRKEFDARLQQEIGGLRTELHQEIGGLRTEFDARLQQEIGSLRTELHQEIGSLRTELKSEIAEVRLGVESLRATMYKLLLAQAAVIVGLILGLQRLFQL